MSVFFYCNDLFYYLTYFTITIAYSTEFRKQNSNLLDKNVLIRQ